MSEACKEIPMSKLKELYALVIEARSPKVTFWKDNYDKMRDDADEQSRNAIYILEAELRHIAEIR